MAKDAVDWTMSNHLFSKKLGVAIMKERNHVMLCDHGDCVDVSRIICEEKFTEMDEIIECENLQSMTRKIGEI